jgi:hypothetical protein
MTGVLPPEPDSKNDYDSAVAITQCKWNTCIRNNRNFDVVATTGRFVPMQYFLLRNFLFLKLLRQYFHA